MASANASQPTLFISTDALLEHWQGHRRLTRRVIERFPDDQLFSFSIGKMRTFGDLANEMLSMAGPMAHGLATLEWGGYAPPKATSKTSGTGRSLYLIDNEVHHRGQGYVYLRALGVEPPPFWER